MLKICVVVLLLASIASAEQYRPLVIWHGLGDTCCSVFSMMPIIRHIKKQLPGIHVHSLNIGLNANKTDSDFLSQMLAGWTVSANKQVEEAIGQIDSDAQLSRGFNALGFSQGGQFLRAVVQRTPEKMGAKVFNYVSLGGQHQGVFGFPDTCNFTPTTSSSSSSSNGTDQERCDFIRNTLSLAAYESWAQRIVTPSNYWHDPLKEQAYLSGCSFLPDINNGNTLNEDYRQRVLALNKFVMVKFENDTVVVPRESEWFGFYAPGQDEQIETLQETELYQKDLLGLKELDERGDLVFLQTPGEHLQFTFDWFDANVLPYLNNTLA
jgi:palmitoyl-protein thioesterase